MGNDISKKLEKGIVHYDLYYRICRIAEECNTNKVRIHISELSNLFGRKDTIILKRLKTLKKAKLIKFKMLLNNAVLVTIRIPLHKEDEQKEFLQK